MILETPIPTFSEGFLFISKYPYPGIGANSVKKKVGIGVLNKKKELLSIINNLSKTLHEF